MHLTIAHSRRAGKQAGFVKDWGPLLFIGTLLAVLGFFYWLLIYSGGVGGHGG